MAVNYIEVDTVQLDADIRRLREDAARAREGLKKLKEELDGLNGMWEGSASAAFRRETAKDYSLMQSMISTVEELADSMAYAKKEYLKCERSVTDAVNSIRI